MVARGEMIGRRRKAKLFERGTKCREKNSLYFFLFFFIYLFFLCKKLLIYKTQFYNITYNAGLITILYLQNNTYELQCGLLMLTIQYWIQLLTENTITCITGYLLSININ